MYRWLHTPPPLCQRKTGVSAQDPNRGAAAECAGDCTNTTVPERGVLLGGRNTGVWDKTHTEGQLQTVTKTKNNKAKAHRLKRMWERERESTNNTFFRVHATHCLSTAHRNRYPYSRRPSLSNHTARQKNQHLLSILVSTTYNDSLKECLSVHVMNYIWTKYCQRSDSLSWPITTTVITALLLHSHYHCCCSALWTLYTHAEWKHK